MTTLVLDTSTERGILAAFNLKTVVQDGKVMQDFEFKEENCLFEEQLPFGLQSSHFVLPILQKKIEEGVFQQEALTSIIVGIGPGSYTGIRVGATIAKCLAFALDIPVIGVSTLEAFVPNQEGPYAVVIDAKIGGVYMQKGVLSRGKTHFMSQPQAYSLDEAVRLLHDVSYIVTPYAEKIASKLEASNLEMAVQDGKVMQDFELESLTAGGDHFQKVKAPPTVSVYGSKDSINLPSSTAVSRLMPHQKWEWQECYPSAYQMLQVGIRKGATQSCTSTDARLELLYLRKTQAEIGMVQKGSKKVTL